MNKYMPIKWTMRRYGHILRKVESPKTEPGRIENMNKPSTSNRIE